MLKSGTFTIKTLRSIAYSEFSRQSNFRLYIYGCGTRSGIELSKDKQCSNVKISRIGVTIHNSACYYVSLVPLRNQSVGGVGGIYRPKSCATRRLRSAPTNSPSVPTVGHELSKRVTVALLATSRSIRSRGPLIDISIDMRPNT